MLESDQLAVRSLLTSEDEVGRHYIFLSELTARALGVDSRVVFRGDTDLSLPSTRTVQFLALCSDKDIYSPDQSIHISGVCSFTPSIELSLIVTSGKGIESQHRLKLDEYGLGIACLPPLPVGRYTVSLGMPRQWDFSDKETAKCTFEVAEYRLLPLVAEVASCRQLDHRNLQVRLSLSSFGREFSGPVKIRLKSGQKVLDRAEGVASFGMVETNLNAKGTGPFEVEVIAPKAGGHAATAPLSMAAGAHALKPTLFSRLGNRVYGSLLELDDSTSARNMFFQSKTSASVPLELESVVTNEAILIASCDLSDLQIRALDPVDQCWSAVAEERSLKQGEIVRHPVDGVMGVFACGAFVDGLPWEGWAVVIAPSRLSPSIHLPERVEPHSEVEIEIDLGDPTADAGVLLLVKDARLQCQQKPELNLARRIKTEAMQWDQGLSARVGEFNPPFLVNVRRWAEAAGACYPLGDGPFRMGGELDCDLHVLDLEGVITVRKAPNGQDWEVRVTEDTWMKVNGVETDGCLLKDLDRIEAPWLEVVFDLTGDYALKMTHRRTRDFIEGISSRPQEPVSQLVAHVAGRTEHKELSAQPCVIGSGANCNWVIDHHSVAPHHACIERKGKKHYTVRALEGADLHVNGLPAAEHLLIEGDTFTIGDVVVMCSDNRHQADLGDYAVDYLTLGGPRRGRPGKTLKTVRESKAAKGATLKMKRSSSGPVAQTQIDVDSRFGFSPSSESASLEVSEAPGDSQTMDVSFIGVLQASEGKLSTRLVLACQTGTFAVEAFALNGKDWGCARRNVEVRFDPMVELVTPRFIDPPCDTKGQLHVCGAGRLDVYLFFNGEPQTFRHAGKKCDGHAVLEGQQSRIEFPLRIGLYRAEVTDRLQNRTRTAECRVDEPGRIRRTITVLRLLPVGEELDILSDPSIGEIMLLPDIKAMQREYLDDLSTEKPTGAWRLASSLLNAFLHYQICEDGERRRAELAILELVARLRRLWLPQRGFLSGDMTEESDPCPWATRWTAEYLQGVRLIPQEHLGYAVQSAQAEALRMAEDVYQALKEEYPPRKPIDARTAYLILRFGPTKRHEKAEAWLEKQLRDVKDHPHAWRCTDDVAFLAAGLLRIGSTDPALWRIIGRVMEGHARRRLGFFAARMGLMALLVELQEADCLADRKAPLLINGEEMSLKDGMRLPDPIRSVRPSHGVLALRVRQDLVEDWFEEKETVGIEVSIEGDRRLLRIGDNIQLTVRLMSGYERGDVAWVCLPPCLTWPAGGGQSQLFSVDFGGGYKTTVNLLAISSSGTGPMPRKQHAVVCLRNMFDGERASRAHCIGVRIRS